MPASLSARPFPFTPTYPGQLHPQELEAKHGQDSCIQGSRRQGMARTIASAGVGGKAWPGQLHPRELGARHGQDSCIHWSWRQSMARTIASAGVGGKAWPGQLHPQELEARHGQDSCIPWSRNQGGEDKAMLIVWSIDHGDGDGLNTRCCG